MTALCHGEPRRLGWRLVRGLVGPAASLLLLNACAGGGDTPGMPWLLWATARSLAGAPPTPPDFYAEPVRVSDTLKFTAISAGGDHTCALTVDGDTYCWGANRYDQLGSDTPPRTCGGGGAGAYSCSATPVRLEHAPRFTALAASRWATCGLDVSGAAHCWGFGLGGRSTDGLPESSGVPVEVPGEHAFSALASSASSNGRTCGLTADGRVWCWGLSEGTQSSAEAEVFSAPTEVPTRSKLVAISFGGAHGCGIDERHSAYCWGNNEFGSLGTGSSGHRGGIRESPAPVAVQGGPEFRQVVAGGGHSCGLDTEGSAHCWGLGYPVEGNGPEHLRLSRGPLPHGARPVPLEMNGARWTALSTADTQTCGLSTDGEAYCFRATPMQGVDKRPVRIESDRTFVEVAVGNRHACAIDTDGHVYCWGDSSSGQVGRPPTGRRW